MKGMLKKVFWAALLLCIANQKAEADIPYGSSLYLDILPFHVSTVNGEEREFSVDVVLYNPNYEVENYEFYLYLPPGVEFVDISNDEARTPSGVEIFGIDGGQDGVHVLVFNLMGRKYSGTSGTVSTIRLKTTRDFTYETPLDIELREIAISNGAGEGNTYDSKTMMFSGDLSTVSELPKLHGRYTADAVSALLDAGLGANDILTSIDLTEATDVDESATLTTQNKNMLVYLGENKTIANEDNVVSGDICEKLVLHDGNYPFSNDREFTAVSAGFDRAFNKQHSTICLPFELNASDVAKIGKVYDFVKASGDKLHFTTNETGTVAYQPYMILPNSGTVFNDMGSKQIRVTESSPVQADGYSFNGVLSPVQLLSDESATHYGYLESNGTFIQVGQENGAHCKPFRGYFTTVTAEGNSKVMSVVFDDTTGVNQVFESGVDGPSYDLGGMPVDSKDLPSGTVYIRNGKKNIKK